MIFHFSWEQAVLVYKHIEKTNCSTISSHIQSILKFDKADFSKILNLMNFKSVKFRVLTV